MAEKLTPEALIGEVAEILSEQDTVEGVFVAAERCLTHLETNDLDRKSTRLNSSH